MRFYQYIFVMLFSTLVVACGNDSNGASSIDTKPELTSSAIEKPPTGLERPPSNQSVPDDLRPPKETVQ